MPRLTLQRSEHTRNLYYGFGAVRTLENLGPQGTEVDIVVHNFGRKKPNGNVTCRAIPPTKNPILCPSVHLGNVILLAFAILKERFPDFVNFQGENSYTDRPILTAVMNPDKPCVASTVRDHWKKVNLAVGIHTGDAVTHIMRVMPQQKLMDEPGMACKYTCFLFYY